ncbi:hypothetical protein VJ918_07115 [Adlercreutzia sp. R21]|uniref:Uncharacterized protein n=1 Tax=Adlercreutzia wanghongyangiae TaxID=3111451 RepID=A0ABU6IJ07_9ACTN|nr:hypothetical protein [Adlercreutzia sp. R21]MEC4176446.1 hypothetical protein [Adlercreutzia sp. R7]MEC4184578.1 hypothetical protein [Adlercreutzia sp. R21]
MRRFEEFVACRRDIVIGADAVCGIGVEYGGASGADPVTLSGRIESAAVLARILSEVEVSDSSVYIPFTLEG